MKGGMGLSPIEGVDWPWHFVLIQPVTTELFSKFLRRGCFFGRFCAKTSSFFSFLRVTSGDTVCFLYIQKRPSQNHSSGWNPGGTLAAGLHNQNIGGSKSVGSSTLSGVGFDGDSLGGTDDCEFWILNKPSQEKSQKNKLPTKRHTACLFFRTKKNPWGSVDLNWWQIFQPTGPHGLKIFWNIKLDMFFVIWIFKSSNLVGVFLLISFLPLELYHLIICGCLNIWGLSHGDSYILVGWIWIIYQPLVDHPG